MSTGSSWPTPGQLCWSARRSPGDCWYRPALCNRARGSQVAKATCLVGPVGTTAAGRTTLVNLLMRFYELDAGWITLDGVDVAAMSRHELRSAIGVPARACEGWGNRGALGGAMVRRRGLRWRSE
ncbi:ATP-binding cassette domain-containing protein [Arthrobacter sp. UKPF54-2]|nr:ATP-binding cassette domain-containing protein [Arthrobacter sp. UKPF54-2]